VELRSDPIDGVIRLWRHVRPFAQVLAELQVPLFKSRINILVPGVSGILPPVIEAEQEDSFVKLLYDEGTGGRKFLGSGSISINRRRQAHEVPCNTTTVNFPSQNRVPPNGYVSHLMGPTS
jgi:hypothetical protein